MQKHQVAISENDGPLERWSTDFLSDNGSGQWDIPLVRFDNSLFSTRVKVFYPRYQNDTNRPVSNGTEVYKPERKQCKDENVLFR